MSQTPKTGFHVCWRLRRIGPTHDLLPDEVTRPGHVNGEIGMQQQQDSLSRIEKDGHAVLRKNANRGSILEMKGRLAGTAKSQLHKGRAMLRALIT